MYGDQFGKFVLILGLNGLNELGVVFKEAVVWHWWGIGFWVKDKNVVLSTELIKFDFKIIYELND